MWIQVYYKSGRRPHTYGSETNISKYEVQIRPKRQQPTVDVEFMFGDGVRGRGGEFGGLVTSGFLSLPDDVLAETCRRILAVLANPARPHDSFKVDEKRIGNVDSSSSE